jgi:enoyl-[acyl-carrier-protein] reductase (NADH)
MRSKDPSIRIIAAEMAEYAGRVNALWAMAITALDHDADRALSRLIDLTILLEHHIPIEVADILKVAKEATDLLSDELPDEEEVDEHPS